MRLRMDPRVSWMLGKSSTNWETPRSFSSSSEYGLSYSLPYHSSPCIIPSHPILWVLRGPSSFYILSLPSSWLLLTSALSKLGFNSANEVEDFFLLFFIPSHFSFQSSASSIPNAFIFISSLVRSACLMINNLNKHISSYYTQKVILCLSPLVIIPVDNSS